MAKNTITPMDEYYKIIDREIMLCDGPEELAMYASAMMACSMTIMNTISGPDKTRIVLHLALDDLNTNYPPGEQYDKRTTKGSTTKTGSKPRKGSNL